MTAVVIAAGGTGGHVFPGLALADAMAARANVIPVFAGTRRGFEHRLVPERGYEIELFEGAPMKGGGATQALVGAWTAARSVASAVRFLRRKRPAVVVGIGGYAAGPVCMAAAVLGIPVALVEPNSVMGLSNRIIAPVARRIYVGWGDPVRRFGAAKVRRLGVPIRGVFVARPYKASETQRVLVLGGSQGAQALNERVPEALQRVASDFARLEVRHQSGEGRDRGVLEAYSRAGLAKSVRVMPFSTRVEEDLVWADLVVARAGAGTLAEIAAVGRASILIPYPHAADDHQAKNAEDYAGRGAAIWLREAAADSTRLALEIGRVLTDVAGRERLAACAISEGRPDATSHIADDVLALAGISPRPVTRSSSSNGATAPVEAI